MCCRKGNDDTDYDVVIGGVANDKVFNTVELFFDGLIDKTEAIRRLRYEKPNLQICFRFQKALEDFTLRGAKLYDCKPYNKKKKICRCDFLLCSKREHFTGSGDGYLLSFRGISFDSGRGFGYALHESGILGGGVG